MILSLSIPGCRIGRSLIGAFDVAHHARGLILDAINVEGFGYGQCSLDCVTCTLRISGGKAIRSHKNEKRQEVWISDSTEMGHNGDLQVYYNRVS